MRGNLGRGAEELASCARAAGDGLRAPWGWDRGPPPPLRSGASGRRGPHVGGALPLPTTLTPTKLTPPGPRALQRGWQMDLRGAEVKVVRM